jgi:potassium channel subfamily K
VTISQLANEVSIIVQYFSGKQNERRAIWRRRYETTFRQEAERRNPEATLAEEIRLIDEIARREELITQVWDLVWSLSSLTIFWVCGAAVFQACEPGWTFWNALYFEGKSCCCVGNSPNKKLKIRSYALLVVFCLTIGYGDVTPTSQGGRVFFVCYSIAAVPLIASFVIRELPNKGHSFALDSKHLTTILP